MEGILHVKVFEAKDLPPRDKTGKSDPYCVFMVNGRRFQYTTTMKPQTLFPKWDESFTMPLHNAHVVKYEKEGELIVELWDWDRYSPDDFIGRVVVSLSTISTGASGVAWYPLQTKLHFHEKVYGHLRLGVSIEWVPVGPMASTFGARFHQKFTAKLNQFARFGSHLITHQIENMRSWGRRRTADVLGKVLALKPPHYSFSKDMVKEFRQQTHFNYDELELLFYAFRSFAYPNEQMDKIRFRKIFPLFREESDIVDAVFAAFNQRPHDDLSFDEFAVSLSMVTRGSADERLKMAARFYSKAEPNISRQSFSEASIILVEVMKAPYQPQQIEKMVEQIFGQEENVTGEHFIEIVKKLEAEAHHSAIHSIFHITKKHPAHQGEAAAPGSDDVDDDVDTDQWGVGYCFGLFHYLYKGTLATIEHMVSGNDSAIKPDKEGFLMKKSGASWAKYWFCLRNGFFWYLRDAQGSAPARVLYIESNCEVEPFNKKENENFFSSLLSSEKISHQFRVHLGGEKYEMILAADSEKQKDKWIERIQRHFSVNNNNIGGTPEVKNVTHDSVTVAAPGPLTPDITNNNNTTVASSSSPQISANNHNIRYWFDSFAPVRNGIAAQWFVDGRDTYEAIAEAIRSARQEIFITDWFLSPEVYLKRYPYMMHRLDTLLAEKAKYGVKIYVIVWNETKLAMNLNSERVKQTLEALHDNIQVICHPMMLMKWSHHQKTVIVDQDIAFVGGLDMCFGRYDTPAHQVQDPHSDVFPGKDYYNPAKGADFDGLDAPFTDLIDRRKIPRMPWHDVNVRVDGYAARDVAKNFIQRWNHHRNEIQMLSSLLTPKSTLCPPLGYTNCQVLRSICEWSGSDGRTENSVAKAMLHSISNAQHFVYIENQYFISNTAKGVKNEIGTCLIQRIRRAIRERREKNLPSPDFRVVVVLPVHPEGTYKDSAAIRYIMKWQYDTISRGGHSIIEELEKEFKGEDISEYISFYSLRNYGILQGAVVNEQIYVHTKLTIVDDRIAIIGSANINDRSLLGDRDSEIAVIVNDEELVPSKMAGKPFMAGKFALSLRLNLWREHLGLALDDSKGIMDPVIPETYNELWRATARSNTELYEDIFGVMEGETLESIRDTPKKDLVVTQQLKEKLEKIHGHLILYPLKFLIQGGLDAGINDLDIHVAGVEVFV